MLNFGLGWSYVLCFPRSARCRDATFVSIVLASILVGCGGGTVPPGVSAPAPPQPSISVVPSTALVPVGTNERFFAAVTNVAGNVDVKWAASTGTIDQAGNYIAPASVPNGGSDIVTATLASNPQLSASAQVTVSSSPVTLAPISPATASVKAGFTTLFTTSVSGATNQTVIWSVSDPSSNDIFPGSIVGGDYAAPVPVLTPHTYTITATSQADPSKTVSASVTAIPLENQEQQNFPIELGTSGVNANTQDCCSGTLGSLLIDEKGKQYILSNNHVIGRVGHALAGEAVVQPGFIEALCDPSGPKEVATFTAAAPIGANVDAAIAEVVPGAVDPNGAIIGLGGIKADGSYIAAAPSGSIAVPTIGMAVAKSGRTTGLSCGVVEAINGTILIDLPAECGNPSDVEAVFQGQVILNDIVQPGDSGSLIVDAATAEPLGIVAGLSSDGQFATANPVGEVLGALDAASGEKLSFVGGADHLVSCTNVSGSLASQSTSSRKISQKKFGPLARGEVLRAIAIQTRHENDLMQLTGVLGVAIGSSRDNPQQPALLIFLKHGDEKLLLPAEIDGLTVQAEFTERFGPGTLSTKKNGSACAEFRHH